MPLVAPLPADHDPSIAELARFFEGTLGLAPDSVLTMMRRPALARAFTEPNRAAMDNHGRVTSELKRLIGHVASRVAGCRDCWNDAMATELEAPAAADGQRWLAAHGWSRGKHGRV